MFSEKRVHGHWYNHHVDSGSTALDVVDQRVYPDFDADNIGALWEPVSSANLSLVPVPCYPFCR